ncbi:hypothetical protein [Streptomyces triticiradicis]|uniref:DUF916 domain-containing protein n=1 Tax=Streptomyces triticiradicis TaxID=2651189 RepID=A0A7J5DBU2_9ACTN|nr:hypothetical protein [Streptomyces triticiradicis]KAB1986288.1 hypothetical protein F8144_23125 [Streptomyces triticiradicis]
MPYALPAARVLGLTLVLLGAAPTASAAEGWSVAPAAGGAADGRPSVYAEGAPGTVLQDAVSVLNPGARPLTVRLRGTAADNAADGASATDEQAAGADAGAWIAFAGHARGRRTAVRELSVRVPAHTRADVPFTIGVPAGAAPGDHPGAIVASGGGRTSAVRVRVRVPGPALSALTVEHVGVGGGRISYELVNRGTTVLAPRLAVHADGVLGTLLDRGPRTLPVELPPGGRVVLHEPWTDPPVLDAVDVRLTVTAAGGVRSTATVSARFVPWGAAAGAGGVLVAVPGAWFAVRRRRRAGTRGPWRRGRRERDGGAGERPGTEVELTGAVS